MKGLGEQSLVPFGGWMLNANAETIDFGNLSRKGRAGEARENPKTNRTQSAEKPSNFTQYTASDETVEIVGRVSSVRAQKRVSFVVLRDSHGNTLQVVVLKQDCNDIEPESILRLKGKFVVPGNPIKSDETSIKNVEFLVASVASTTSVANDASTTSAANDTSANVASNTPSVQRISISEPLPIQVSDLNHYQDAVGFAKRLDERVLDLRAASNQAIFRLKSYMTQCLSNFFWENEFVQIQTPKLTSVPSEGGAEVFKTMYFDTPAYLVQSPQLFKQMCVQSDFTRVFEIGPVFRAEDSRDSRHLTEFIGVDMEMAIADVKGSENGECNAYHVVPKTLWALLRYTVGEMMTAHRDLILKANPDFENIIIPEEPIIVPYWEVIATLNANGFPDLKPTDDLNNDCEIKLGEYFRQYFGSDLIIVDKYPKELRPFYTMQDPDHPGYTNSYDIIFRGQEVLSGAQREHRYPILMEAVRAKGITAEHLDFYLNSFRYGSFPHAGGGFGLERLLARFLGLPNIKSASLFPRAPNRLKP